MDNESSDESSNALTVLYDGWALVHHPSSPVAVHLLALLTALPLTVRSVVALPGPTETVFPPGIEIINQPAPGTVLSHLNWEQRSLPAAARKTQANIIHLFGPHPPLASGPPVVVSPAEYTTPASEPVGAGERLREALAVGAARGVRSLLWPTDLEPPPVGAPCSLLPPIVPPDFYLAQPALPGLPESYILFPGPLDELALAAMMAGWDWAGPAVGQQAALLLPDDGQAETRRLATALAQRSGLEDTLAFYPVHSSADWAALYQQARVVVTLGPQPPWGSPLLLAMAAGRPLVSSEDARTGQRVGPAAYLTPAGDARAFGAAMTTLVVETEMAEALGEAAAARAVAWNSAQFGQALMAAYQGAREFK